jgi:hypothetical protein
MEAISTRALIFGAFSISTCPSASMSGPLELGPTCESTSMQTRASARREVELPHYGEKAIVAVACPCSGKTVRYFSTAFRSRWCSLRERKTCSALVSQLRRAVTGVTPRACDTASEIVLCSAPLLLNLCAALRTWTS